MRNPLLNTMIVPVVAVVAISACGGDDDSSADDAADADVATESESGAPPTPPAQDDAAVATTIVPGGVEIDEVPADPAELADPTGTITGGGQTYEAAGYAQMWDSDEGGYVDLGGDFLICEAVNPAFEGAANIIVDLGDDLEFTFRVNDGEPFARFGGDFSGEETDDVTYERDGNTISGAAQFADAGTVDFDIDCG